MVQILLSTYNGARYLKALMQSLLTQNYPHVKILIRDDGSSDGTVNLLREFATTFANVEVVFGKNLGFVRSFFKLFELSSPTADYFALCDQDDVWQKDKVSRAVGILSRCARETAGLYCSRIAIVDENLKLLGYSALPTKGLSFRNALVECQTPGCTTLVNQAARQLLLREFPQQVCSHDWWIYLVISAFGTAVYDEEPRIFYRKHFANVFGISLGMINTWRVKIRQFLKTGKFQLVVKQAEEFRRIYGSSLSDENRRVLDRFLDGRNRLWNRLGHAMSCEVYRQSKRDHLILKARIVLNRL